MISVLNLRRSKQVGAGSQAQVLSLTFFFSVARMSELGQRRAFLYYVTHAAPGLQPVCRTPAEDDFALTSLQPWRLNTAWRKAPGA